jgi:hypothetical protein
VFVGALIAPRTTKDAYQDIYGNPKIPLSESVKIQSSPADACDWFTTKTNVFLIHSSLTGLPTVGISEERKTYLAIESSYLYPTCTLSDAEIDKAWIRLKEENRHNDGGYMAIDLNFGDELRDGCANHIEGGRVLLGRLTGTAFWYSSSCTLSGAKMEALIA